MFCTCCSNAEEVELAEVDAQSSLQVVQDSTGPLIVAKQVTLETQEEGPKAEKAEKAEKVVEKVQVELPKLVGDFQVELKSETAGEWGMELDFIDPKGLTIVQISEGRVKDYNEKAPSQALKVFDRITTVNGESGNLDLLHERLLKSKDLVLQVSRPQEKVVTVKKTSPSLGALMDYKDSSSGVLLMEIRAGGFLAQWNADHPAHALHEGFRIVKFDGVALKGADLVEKIKQATVLNLTVLVY